VPFVNDPLSVSSKGLEGLRSFYFLGEDIELDALPVGTRRVVARRASGASFEAPSVAPARFADLPAATYCVEAWRDDETLLAEEFTTVGRDQGERPVHGFATSFKDEDVEPVLAWHRSLRSTVVQIYDWMASYTEPLGPRSGWQDPSHRPVSFEALRQLSAGLGELGAVSHAYAPVYAVGTQFAADHPEMLMYEDDGQAIRFLDQIVLANPGNEEWQRHFVASYGEAMDAVGFNGLHVDTYGYPRVAFDAGGRSINMREAYEAFLLHLRAARPRDLISFNQVNGVPSATSLPDEPIFRYCEIWPPNSQWRHFEGLMDRTSGRAGLVGDFNERHELIRGSLACYPPVWGIDSPEGLVVGDARDDALRTVVTTEAISTSIGVSSLIYGDLTAALCDPYYPKHARLSDEEATTVLAWRRFALRCRDLFIEGEDTSWYEVNDENGSVAIGATAPVYPEPVGGGVFGRVVQRDGLLSVSVVDLTGSEHGKWSEPTREGAVRSVSVRVLLGHPEEWEVEAAVLGHDGGRFRSIESKAIEHRQGLGIEVELPMIEGWSVLRVSKKARQ
jgi:dextranase